MATPHSAASLQPSHTHDRPQSYAQELPRGSTFERLLRLTAPDGGLHLAATVDNSGPGATSDYNADAMRNVTMQCAEDPGALADLECLNRAQSSDGSPLPVWLVATIASGAPPSPDDWPAL